MNSQRTILAVIIFLGLVAVATVVGGFFLAYNDVTVPGELIALGSVSVGAIAGILSKTGTEPIPVVAQDVAPPAPAPGPDLTKLREQLGGAANAILDIAHAIGDDPPVEAVLADDGAGQ